MPTQIIFKVLSPGSFLDSAPLLQIDDLIGIGLCILALLITYFWQKKSKNQESENDKIAHVRPIRVRVPDYDIFGRPKNNQKARNNQDDIPFTNFSLKQAYWLLALFIIISIAISAFRQYS